MYLSIVHVCTSNVSVQGFHHLPPPRARAVHLRSSISQRLTRVTEVRIHALSDTDRLFLSLVHPHVLSRHNPLFPIAITAKMSTSESKPVEDKPVEDKPVVEDKDALDVLEAEAKEFDKAGFLRLIMDQVLRLTRHYRMPRLIAF